MIVSLPLFVLVGQSDKSTLKGRSKSKRKARRKQSEDKNALIEDVSKQAQEKESEQKVDDEDMQKEA